MWNSLRRMVPFRRGDDKRRNTLQRAHELERSYRAVFLCPEGQLVLADLAAECGMYLAPAIDVTERQGGYQDGRKAIFARILSMVRVSPEEHAALQEAARFEALSQHEED
jgi:hypothetical protein